MHLNSHLYFFPERDNMNANIYWCDDTAIHKSQDLNQNSLKIWGCNASNRHVARTVIQCFMSVSSESMWHLSIVRHTLSRIVNVWFFFMRCRQNAVDSRATFSIWAALQHRQHCILASSSLQFLQPKEQQWIFNWTARVNFSVIGSFFNVVFEYNCLVFFFRSHLKKFWSNKSSWRQLLSVSSLQRNVYQIWISNLFGLRQKEILEQTFIKKRGHRRSWSLVAWENSLAL